MTPRLFFFALFPFILLNIIFSAASGTDTIDCDVDLLPAQRSELCTIIDPGHEASFSVPGTDLSLSFTIPQSEYFSKLGQALIWDYPFFEGDWNYFRLILLYPLSGMVFFGLFIVFLPMAINAAGVVVRLLRGG